MRFLAAFFTALMIMFGSVANAAIVARDGELFFRYRGGPAATDTSVVSPFDADVTARFIGVVGFDLSEKIPLIPGKVVKRWALLDGTLPNGIRFGGAEGLFEGRPTDEGMGREVYLQGFDAAGGKNAIAHVVFDIFKPRDQFGVVDFYGHTDQYRFEQLPVPFGTTIDHWKVHYPPPPGVSVIGRNYDGTPTKPGRYPVVVQGFDYLNREVILMAGYYLVEDGPTFPEIADDVRPIDPKVGRQIFDLWRPAMRSVAPGNDYTRMLYEIELAPGEDMPGTVFAQGYIGRLVGDVFYPYQTAKVRWKATDVDGTTGVSNWFTFGTSYQTPGIGANPLGPFDGIVGEPFKVVFKEQGTAGVRTYSLVEGELPEGLELDQQTGEIAGTPVKAETQSGLVVKLEIVNGGKTDVTQTVPFEIRIDDQPVGVQISLAPAAARSARLTTLAAPSSSPNIATAKTMKRLYVRTNSTVALKVTPVGAVFDPVSIKIDPEFPLPDGLTFSKSTNIISGSLSDEWKGKVRVSLLNGNGKTAEGIVDVGAFNKLAVEPPGDVFVTQYEDVDPAIPVKISGIMPDQSGAALPKVELVGQVPSGISYSFLFKGLVGGTTDPAGTYGPVIVRVTDGSGETTESAPFMIYVQPRKGLSISVADVEMKLSQSKASPVVQVVRPPLGKKLGLTFSLSSGTLPQGMSVNPANGDLEGQPKSVGAYEGLRIKVSDDEGYSAVSAPFKLTVTPAGALAAASVPYYLAPIGFPATLEPVPFLNVVGTLDYLSAEGLPEGLEMTSDGVVSGIPTEIVSNRVVNVSVKDGAGREAKGKMAILVTSRPSVSFENGITTLEVAQYENKSFDLVFKNFIGTPEISIIRGTLPAGFKVSPLGRLSGSAAEKGSYDRITVRATDSRTQLSADVTFRMVVGNRKATELSYSDPATVFLGSQANLPLLPVVNNARYPLNFTFLGGRLPAGVKFQAEKGMFVGSPTETGRFNDVFVSVTDAENVSAIARFDMLSTKMGPVYVSPLARYRYRAGETFVTPQASFDNFVEPATFEVIEQSGAALSFDRSKGIFSGSIPAPATFKARLTLVDDHGRVPASPAEVEIKALPPVSVHTQPANVDVYQYAADGVTVAAIFDNLIGSASYSLEGALPAGLSFDASTGVIKGQASQTGTFSNLRISATDSHDGSKATTAAFTIKVLPRKALTASLPAKATTLVNRSVSQIAVVSVGNAAYGKRPQFAVSGRLPAGVTFTTAGGVGTFGGVATEVGEFPNIYVTVTDVVGATAIAGPMTIKSVLNGEQIFLSVQDIVTHVGWAFNTPQPVVDNKVGKIRFYSYDMVPEINLDPLNGVMSGTFKVPYDFEFDLYVGDETARVTSDRLKVVAIPDVRAIYPSIVQAQQYVQIAGVYPDVSYKIGQISYAMANPAAWPEGVRLDPYTGAIYGVPLKSGTFEGLQVAITDTNGRDTMTRMSNTFSIAMSKSEAKPYFDPLQAQYVGAVNIGAVSVITTVRDSISRGGWPYGGLTFSLDGTLPAGLSFDKTNGNIAGTPAEPSEYRKFTISVTDANGYTAKSTEFRIGVKPNPPLGLTRAVSQYVSTRAGLKFSIPAPTVSGAVGQVRFARGPGTSTAVTATVDPADGSVKATATAAGQADIQATDDLGQTTVLSYYVGILPPVTASTPTFSVMQGYSFTDGRAPTVLNNDGEVTFEWRDLPAGLAFDAASGKVSGTTTAAPGTYTAKLIATDTTSSGPETPVSIIVVDPAPHRFWRVTGFPGFFRGSVGMVSFIHPDGENLSLRVNTGGAKATSSPLEGAPREKPEWIFDGTHTVNLMNDPALDYSWGVLEFNQPVTVFKMTYLSCPSQIMFWNGQLSYSDDGTRWIAASPAFNDRGDCVKVLIRNK